MAAKVDPIHQHGGLAIRGYDPVAYYQQSAPVKGSSQFSSQWQGARWLFASAENRDRFQAEPEHYAPQYGGYCAYAVSKGRTASIDPEASKIVDGRLYLQQGGSKEVGAGCTREYREGRQELAGASQVIVAELVISWPGDAADDPSPCA